MDEKKNDSASASATEIAAAAKYEKWKQNGVALRAFFYILGTHMFAGFVWLLFHLGQQAQK